MEIERKFLVTSEGYRRNARKSLIRQGFLSIEKGRVVRVRVMEGKAFLTIKGLSVGASRPEFEYSIPLEDALSILDHLCIKPLIEKYRYVLKHAGFTWEVDEFLGENEGLVIAEIELESEGQEFPRPEWVGNEVTGDPKYYNSNLVQKPYGEWEE